ncbi:GNAT family N-acetyltransferase [Flavilitoribacter nigricans]|uniref:GNAT family N-acetyltransferase n=1 Tax=Flavilitoribacter nigricans (strain ATCC 23147 / DSM 23189 / NBRC 102662 / NCIMB 1420 / SS-2) TaxID=1122177 RepID=A0A2D0NFP4_FLAN2|nr:GNAT family N-acetyltransferase [Flavilitoribacter nigricans]PHN07297.1 GNAT family N-acetyltransferase [Flavilitoribacter nigricans DSM 23189 = NBRC 102662]
MVKIIKCSPADLVPLRTLAIKTFVDTYEAFNTPEVMAGYLEDAFSEEQLSRELRHPESEFFALEANGLWLGYIKLNEGDAQTDERSGRVLEIERIYVDGAQQGRGYGKLLLETAIDRAREKGKDAIWLGVWEHNPKAIRFYQSQGFVKVGTHIFRIGGEDQNDWVMEKKV